jgi:methionine sulfoxide reductase heme-binding subunit
MRNEDPAPPTLEQKAAEEEVVLQLIWPWQDRGQRFSWLKAGTFALMFVPAIWMSYQVGTEQFGLAPIGSLIYWSGVWATAMLLLALAITPASAIFRWNQLIIVRRMIGVTALVYTVAHIVLYFSLRFWDVASIAHEMLTRVTLIVATVSTLGLIALGATSVDAAVRRMGAANWQRIHNTIYVASVLALVHYLLSPGTFPEQYLMSGMLFWLMVWRVLNRRGLGADVRALAMLAVASCLFTALLEVGWIWSYHGFAPAGTLANNFSLVLGLSPAWKILVLGLLIPLAAASRQAPRLRPAGFDARKIG